MRAGVPSRLLCVTRGFSIGSPGWQEPRGDKVACPCEAGAQMHQPVVASENGTCSEKSLAMMACDGPCFIDPSK